MHHKGHFLAAGRHADGCGAVRSDLAYQFLVVAVGVDGDVHTLGLTALAQGEDFAVVAIAQGAVVGYREEAHGIVLVVSELHGLAADGVLIDVERAVLLAQVVIGLAVGRPARGAVLTVEVGEFGELPVTLEPHVARDRAGVVLAVGVLIALDVVIQDVAVGIDAQVLHGQRREQACTAAAGAHLIHLGERAAGKQDGLRRGHIGRLEQHRAAVEEAQRGFVAAVGSQALGCATVLADDVHVKAPLAGRRKGHLLAVGAPHGIGVIGRIGRQLMGRSALHRHSKQVPLVGERDGLPIGRNSAKAHPQRVSLCRSTNSHQ